MNDRVKKGFKIFGFVLIVICTLYLAGTIVFLGRFGFRTTYNGEDIYFKTPGELMSRDAKETRNIKLTLLGRNGAKEEMTFGQLGVSNRRDSLFFSVDVNPFLWFLTPFHDTIYSADSELIYDRAKIKEKINDLYLVETGTVYPSDAAVIVNDDGTFSVMSQNDGNVIDKDRLIDVLCEHIDNWDLVIDLDKEDCYVKAETITHDSDVPLEGVSSLSEAKNVRLSIKMNDKVAENLPASLLDSALYENEQSQLMVRSYLISDYVNALADKYNTKGMTRVFTTSLNTFIRFREKDMDSSTYIGYELDKENLFLNILYAVANGNSGMIEAPWRSTGMELLNVNSDIGDTYIEISIQNQHMWYYKDGLLIIDTDVITGLPDKGRDTPTGIYYVISLNRNYTMYFDDGSAECDYFIKVTNSGVGIHDASWRDVFGGSIWETNGSHGCINTPYDAEVTIFNSLAGMPNYHIPIVIY